MTQDSWWRKRWRDWVLVATALTLVLLFAFALWAIFGRADEEDVTLGLVQQLIEENRALTVLVCDELEDHRHRSELHHRAVFERLSIPWFEPAPFEQPEGCPH